LKSFSGSSYSPDDRKNYFPYFFTFIIANLVTLSKIEHKEQRFMAMIFPLFAIFWGFFWIILLTYTRRIDKRITYTLGSKPACLESLMKIIIKIAIWVYVGIEVKEIVVN